MEREKKTGWWIKWGESSSFQHFWAGQSGRILFDCLACMELTRKGGFNFRMICKITHLILMMGCISWFHASICGSTRRVMNLMAFKLLLLILLLYCFFIFMIYEILYFFSSSFYFLIIIYWFFYYERMNN